ncbi:MAG: hypothetical protein CMJ46_02185 [Planctomyces sp.]|nr:hypothetical protein [Planctomyces sp.]
MGVAGDLLKLIPFLCGRAGFHVLRQIWSDVDSRETVRHGHLDDASRLNATAIEEHWIVPADRRAAEDQLAQRLEWAKIKQAPVSIAGTRYSMGGHTLTEQGLVVDMTSFREMYLEAENHLRRVGAGARWSEVLRFLDPFGMSVATDISVISFPQ